jgi:hypothetical protein
MSDDVISIVVETALDEAVLVGTPASFRKLAECIMDQVTRFEDTPHHGDTALCAAIPTGVFDSLAEVVPTSIRFVDSKQERLEVCKRLGGGLH